MDNMSNKFKIENFCEEHNSEFKKYYDCLNNPFYLAMIIKCLGYVNHEKIQAKIFSMIKDKANHKIILDKLNKISIIIHFYKQNNLIKRSEIGKFFIFYVKSLKSIDINNKRDLLKLFNKLINYEYVISLLKECFYIFSEYRACIYFMTPSIDFNKTSKKKMKDIIIKFKDNINTLTSIISKTYIGDANPWGSKYYSTAYAMFDTLIIIRKYFKDPLKMLDIKFKVIEKFKGSPININLILIKLRKEGYDLWASIPSVFNSIYLNYTIDGLLESNVFDNKNIYYQKMNNLIGAMAYILVEDGYISNVNIFKKFND